MSDDSQNNNSQGGLFSRFKSKFTSVMNSARGVNSARSSVNVSENAVPATAASLATTTEDKPIVKSRTMSGNPF